MNQLREDGIKEEKRGGKENVEKEIRREARKEKKLSYRNNQCQIKNEIQNE